MLRRLFPLLTLCLILAGAPLVATAQLTMSNVGGGFGSGGGGGRTCTDDTASTNFLARTTGLSNADKDRYCNTIKALEGHSLITGTLAGSLGCGSPLDGLYLFSTNTTTTANFNICGTSYGLTSNGSPTFTAEQGYTGDASTAYFDTSFTASSAPSPNMVQSSAFLMAYILNNRTANNAYVEGGCENSTTGTINTYLIPHWSDGNSYLAVNSTSGVSTATTTAQGAWVYSRTASTTTNEYRNGSTTPVQTDSTNSSIGACPDSMLILANRAFETGAPQAFSGDQLAAFAYGGGLTATQSQNLMNDINTNFMTPLGINVY